MPLKEGGSKVRAKQEKNVGKSSFFVNFKIFGDCREGGVRSLLLNGQHGRYLFNCSEDSHRIMKSEGQIGLLSKLKGVYVTKKSWQNLGGLPGICLSSRSAGSKNVILHGPKHCLELFEAMREFIVLHEFDVAHHTIDDGVSEDGTLSVEHVHLNPAGKQNHPPITKYSPWIPLFDTRRPRARFDDRRKKILEHAYTKSLIPYDETVVAYVVTIKPSLPSICMEKCSKLGIPIGPLIGKLKSGMSVKLDSGQIISPSDVLKPSETAKKVLVVECPSSRYFDDLKNSNKLVFTDEDELVYVFHFTSTKVATEPEYVAWMSTFPSKTSHIMINESGAHYGVSNSYGFTEKLKTISPNLFPESIYSDLLVANGGFISDTPKVFAAKYGSTFHIKPKPQIEYDDLALAKFEIQEARKDVVEKLTNGNISLLCRPQPDITKPNYPKITFLGTGSCISSNYRTVTSILVEIKKNLFIFLDCGEGTLSQCIRHFGPLKTKDILRKLKAIFISHQHADHHLGMIGIIQARKQAFEEEQLKVDKLDLLIPSKMTFFLKYYHTEFEPMLEDCKQVRLEHLLLFSSPGSEKKVQVYFENEMKLLLENLSLKSIITSRALHCAHAFSIALTTDFGFKIVFTGDTRPCKELIELGLIEQSPDILIHEATFEHKLIAEAKAKMHSTFTEAIENGCKMNAKFTMLTHFSQRYPKFPLLDEIKNQTNVGIAFDHMTVNPQTLHLIEQMYIALEMAFPDEIESMILRSERYSETFDSPKPMKRKSSDRPKKMKSKKKFEENGNEIVE